jgi:TPR repeat protein
MSQQKLYIAYLGGEVFARGTGIEPWMRAEAEGGNADAQFRLANAYGSGNGMARDLQAAKEWMDKAVAAGQPHASLRRGRQLLLAGQPAQAIPLLRHALDQLPSERIGTLWLYAARVRNGEAALAQSELAASLDKQDEDDWPQPLQRFYLGKLDAAGLLEEAGKDRKFAARRQCQAENYMAEWHGAQGDKARADSLMASVRAHCGNPAPVAPRESAPAPIALQ